MSSDEYATQLLRVGYELSGRVRREEPDVYGVWLDERMAELGSDYRSLCFALALVVPDDVAWSDLLAWAHEREGPPKRRRPGPAPTTSCGTRGGAERHRRRHERMDPACVDAEREYQRDRYAQAGDNTVDEAVA